MFLDYVYQELLKSLCDTIRDQNGLGNLNGQALQIRTAFFEGAIYYQVSILNSCPT